LGNILTCETSIRCAVLRAKSVQCYDCKFDVLFLCIVFQFDTDVE